MPRWRIYLVSQITIGLLFAILTLISYATLGLLFFRLRFVNIANLRATPRPVIIAPNHKTFVDHFFILPAVIFANIKLLPVRTLAADWLFKKPALGWVLKNLLGAYPAQNGKGLRVSLREVLRILSKGYAVGIYPEGRISVRPGVRNRIRTGAAVLAKKTGSPILPVAIRGHEYLTLKDFFFGRRMITVLFGAPFTIAKQTDTAEAVRDIRSRLTHLYVYHSLKREWMRLFRNIGARGDARKIFMNMYARYSEPHRKYHTAEHILFCLDTFKRVRHLAKNPDAVEAALLFHDFEYSTLPDARNEKKSAVLFKQFADEMMLSDEFIWLVCAYILASMRHESANNDTRLFIDCDLAILGTDPEEFDEYERKIREEFSHVPEKIFCLKRREILERFLDQTGRPHIFLTEAFRNKYEERARSNLARSIAALKKSPSINDGKI